MTTSRKIFKLDESVVNRIAAGEVLQRPWNAVKELIENAHDAGATRISVTIGDGGMTSISITDNGTGIQLDDLPLLCERFATSKLKNFDELTGISTFGFRGEALASISQVARITVTTRTADCSCAYKAYYLEGKMSPLPGLEHAEPIGCAGNQGTTILVDSLFYNLPTRKASFKADDEYSRILQLCQKYAIHWNTVSFSCTKVGSKTLDLNVNDLYPSKLDRIRCIFGNEMGKYLIPLRVKENDMEFNGFVSSLSFGHQPSMGKRFDFMLFVNERLVECQRMKRAVASVYEMLLMRKVFPFFFGELVLPGEMVDVNVHPTKSQVFFLHEEETIGKITRALESTLKGSSYEKSFFVPVFRSSPRENSSPVGFGISQPASSPIQSPPSKTVRIDHKDGNLNSFISPSSNTDISSNSTDFPLSQTNYFLEIPAKKIKQDEMNSLESISLLKQKLQAKKTDFLTDTVFVGIANDELCLFQKGTSLQLMKYRPFLFDFLYYSFLESFGIYENFYEIQTTISMEIGDSDDDRTIQEMLQEYFGIEWSQGHLKIPNIFAHTTLSIPDDFKWSELLDSVIYAIDWEDEEKSLNQIIICLSKFYSKFINFSSNLFDSIKRRCYSKELVKSENIVLLTDLPDLYRVFERC